VLQALGGLTFVLITILILIVAVGIMNTMWIAIRERTREIGTLRAIGMQRGAVLWMFLLESLMLGFLGRSWARSRARSSRDCSTARTSRRAGHTVHPHVGSPAPRRALATRHRLDRPLTFITGIAALFPRAARRACARRRHASTFG